MKTLLPPSAHCEAPPSPSTAVSPHAAVAGEAPPATAEQPPPAPRQQQTLQTQESDVATNQKLLLEDPIAFVEAANALKQMGIVKSTTAYMAEATGRSRDFISQTQLIVRRIQSVSTFRIRPCLRAGKLLAELPVEEQAQVWSLVTEGISITLQPEIQIERVNGYSVTIQMRDFASGLQSIRAFARRKRMQAQVEPLLQKLERDLTAITRQYCASGAALSQ